MPEDELTEDGTIWRDRLAVRDINGTTVFLSRQATAFPTLLYSFALSSFPCARFGSSYSRIGFACGEVN